MDDENKALLGEVLLKLSRFTLERELINNDLAIPEIPQIQALVEPGATFVTLTKDGNLRGCIGSLQAHRPLTIDVMENTRNSAYHDSRFSPLTAEEFPSIKIEISLINSPVEMQFSDEADALNQLRPNIDGVIFRTASHGATYLPQVWEMLPNAKLFLASLKQKAGLSNDYWGSDVKIFTYQVDKWKE